MNAPMILVTDIAEALRVKDPRALLEIDDLVCASIDDMRVAGIKKPEDLSNPLYKQALIFYCKANYGYDADSDKYLKRYERLKVELALSQIYNGD